MSDVNVDLSKAESLVLKKNIAYEQTKRPQRQRLNKKKMKHSPSSEGPAVQYENTLPQLTQAERLCEGAILATEVTAEERADKIPRTEYENTSVAQCSEAQQKYENVCPPSAPDSVYVNVDAVEYYS